MTIRILAGDCRDLLPTLPADSCDCIVTSPPYWGLRDYGVDGQIGLEPTLDAYVETMVGVGRELKRVLKSDGTFWLNLGDSYAMGTKGSSGKGDKQVSNVGALLADRRWSIPSGLKPKDLCGVPWRVAFALQADGWWLRSAIVWHKPNPMPESVTDRPTSAYEMVFLLTKSERYFYDADAIREPGTYSAEERKERSKDGQKTLPTNQRNGMRASDKHRGHSRRHDGFNDRWDAMEKADQCSGMRNARNVWTIAPAQFRQSHFATMPPDLAERCIKAGCPRGGHMLDPFGGAGTTGLVADRLQRHATLIDLNAAYGEMASLRITDDAPLFAEIG